MKWIKTKGMLKAHMNKIVIAGVGVMATVGSASADLAGDITNVSTVITAVTDWVTDIMAVFMEPPLVIFVGLAIGYGVIRQVKKLMRK